MNLNQKYDRLTLKQRSVLLSKINKLASSSDNESIREIVSYVIYPGRKLYCPMLALGAYQAAGGKEDRDASNITLFSELLNLGWMIIDDIIDDHKIRFNRTSAKEKFGMEKVLLSALFIISSGYSVMGKYKLKSLSKVNQTYTGWMNRDLIKDKELSDCEKSLRDLGSYYGTFAKIAAEVAGVSQRTQNIIGEIGNEIGFQLTLIAECQDLKGETFRPAAEELRQGNDILIAVKALEEGINIRNSSNPWKDLRETKAFIYVISLLKNSLSKSRALLGELKNQDKDSLLGTILEISEEKLSQLS